MEQPLSAQPTLAQGFVHHRTCKSLELQGSCQAVEQEIFQHTVEIVRRGPGFNNRKQLCYFQTKGGRTAKPKSTEVTVPFIVGIFLPGSLSALIKSAWMAWLSPNAQDRNDGHYFSHTHSFGTLASKYLPNGLPISSKTNFIRRYTPVFL